MRLLASQEGLGSMELIIWLVYFTATKPEYARICTHRCRLCTIVFEVQKRNIHIRKRRHLPKAVSTLKKKKVRLCNMKMSKNKTKFMAMTAHVIKAKNRKTWKYFAIGPAGCHVTNRQIFRNNINRK